MQESWRLEELAGRESLFKDAQSSEGQRTDAEIAAAVEQCQCQCRAQSSATPLNWSQTFVSKLAMLTFLASQCELREYSFCGDQLHSARMTPGSSDRRDAEVGRAATPDLDASAVLFDVAHVPKVTIIVSGFASLGEPS